jgi:lysophospholipase L1-like esterase
MHVPAISALGALVLLLASSLVAPPGPVAPRSPASPLAGPIVAFGDSLTAGVGADAADSYPSLLGADLGVPVLNMGVSGQTADEALARLDRDVLAQRPSLVIVLFGANEALRGQPVSTAVAGLDALLTALHDAGIPVLLLGIHYHGFGTDFDDALRTLAAKEGAILLLDVLDGVLDRDGLTADGGYHPNALGYRTMESRILPRAHVMLSPQRV